jgi:hypothetical protein
MANRIITVCFDFGDSEKFHILHKAFKKSVLKNTKAELISYHLCEPPMKYNRTRSFVSNSIKLKKWVEELRLCDDGDNIALMDCDMLILNDFFDVFDENFDIGYTKRTNSKWPLNGGVIFVKKSNWTLMFMNTWLKVNNMMLEDIEFHKKWQEKYAGINQASFGYMLEGNMIYNLKPFPCKIYNACGEDLPGFDENVTKILHIKGKLRQTIFKEIEAEPESIRPASIWNMYADMK